MLGSMCRCLQEIISSVCAILFFEKIHEFFVNPLAPIGWFEKIHEFSQSTNERTEFFLGGLRVEGKENGG